MRLLIKPKEIERAFTGLLRRFRSVSFAVAWAGEGFPGYEQLLKKKRKIKCGIVGLHFFQTHPNFVKQFIDDKRVLFVKQSGGVFHPKFYLFENSASDWVCLLGSANFTRGGFNLNAEVCVQFDSSEPGSSEVRDRLYVAMNTFKENGTSFKAKDFDYYKELHSLARKKLGTLSGNFASSEQRPRSKVGKIARPLLDIAVLKMNWHEFLNKVKKDRHHAIEGRALVLNSAKERFQRFQKFELMPPEDRKGIAGFGRSNEIEWAWFGSMFGAGTFKNRVNLNDRYLSRALDSIPLLGAISENNYFEFVENYKRAFPKGRDHGLGTASRLLTMRRPDYFVCFDSANRRGLCNAFNVALSHHDYEKYWTAIIGRILLSRWWNSPRPQSVSQQRIWDGRAAFLDSLYYVPTKK